MRPDARIRRFGLGASLPPLLLACGAILAALVVIALGWNLVQDDDGNGASPTATADLARVESPPDRDPVAASPTPPSAAPLTEPAATRQAATPDTTARAAATTAPSRPSVAGSCPERCLVRLGTSGDPSALLATAGTRASWTGEAWTWAVADRDGIAALEAETEVTVVAEAPDTVRLYMAVMPEGEDDDAPVAEFGTIVDAVDRYRLVEAPSAPAIVTSLTDIGYTIEKPLPAPPTEITLPEEPVSLADIDIGSLMDEVSSDNLEQSILELQATSSTDGTGVGTRYYSATGNAVAAEYLVQRLEGYGLRVWYEDFLMPEGQLLVNVVGEVAGRDDSAVYGVLAHYDTMSTDPTNSPGADDNGTGISAALEIARVLSGYELEHPARFIFVTAEEVGIIGADQFARRAVAEGTPYEGIFNIDSVGSDRQGELLILNADSSSIWMQDLIVEMNDGYGLGQEMLVRQNPVIVADDNKLRDQGLEAVMVARELYGWSPVHHTPEDLAEYVSIPNTATTTMLILLSMASLVQG